MSSALLDAVAAIAGRRVVVIGEAMLDTWLEGRPSGLSREAPVPVVAVERRIDAPGGAANAAVNVAALGGEVTLLSVVGADDEARRLRDALRELGVDDGGLVEADDRRTLAKQRVVAADQIVVRFDTGTTDGLSVELEDRLIERVLAAGESADAILVSDYAYGVVGERVVAALLEVGRLARKAGRPEPVVVVDARDPARHARLRPLASKPNYAEAVRLLGEQEVHGLEARARQVAAGRARILERTGAQLVAVTIDRGGAIIVERDGQGYRTYARPTQDEQACGAGDTYAAALTLAFAASASVPVAAELAQAAAGVVVGKRRTATCSAAELREAVGQTTKRIPSIERLRERVAYLRSQGRRIVFTNGCFDLLHRGHVSYLVRAKALGDELIVAVNSDESVRALKGPDRPINGLDDRLGVLEALSCVDHVVAFDAPTPVELVELVRPDVYVKGGDYSEETLPEAPIVTALGGSVRILPYIDDHSTTQIIARMRETGPDAGPRPGVVDATGPDAGPRPGVAAGTGADPGQADRQAVGQGVRS